MYVSETVGTFWKRDWRGVSEGSVRKCGQRCDGGELCSEWRMSSEARHLNSRESGPQVYVREPCVWGRHQVQQRVPPSKGSLLQKG